MRNGYRKPEKSGRAWWLRCPGFKPDFAWGGWLGWGGLVALLVCHTQAGFHPTNRLRPDFWDVNGTVHAIVATNGTVYVGGDFSYVAPARSKVLAIDLFTGVAQPDFPVVDGDHIHVVMEDAQGGWFIGGCFHEVGGLPRTNVGTTSSVIGRLTRYFQPNPDGAVRALALEGDILYLGGDF